MSRLAAFGPGIWTADGPRIVAAMGFHYPTRMAVIRLDDGGLFVWSPVALSAALKDEIAALGEVRHLVAPNALHDLSLAAWMHAFPSAAVHGAPGLAKRRPDIAFASELGDAPDPGWAGQIDQAVVANAIADEVVFFHAQSGTAIFTDLLQQMPRGWYKGWRAVVARLDLMTAGEPSVPRKFRLAVKRRQARAALQGILAWPAQKLLMAHGPLVAQDARALIARAFRWLR